MALAGVETLEFDRLLVPPLNPDSTNAKGGQRVLDQLHSAFPSQVYEVPGHKNDKNPRANIERIAEQLRAGDVVTPFGGDTTVGRSAQAIILREDLEQVPLAPIPLGHANQMALMLNSRFWYLHPASIFRRGRTVPIYPFELTGDSLPDDQTRLALFTIGIGVTGMAAAGLDTPEFRRHPLSRVPILKKIPEAQVALEGFKLSKPFLKDDQERVEMLLANGRRAAKHARFDVQLPEQAFALLEIGDKRPRTLAPLLGRFAFQLTQPAERLTDDELEFAIEAIDDQPIIGQHDGQPFEIKPGNYKITRAETPVYAVTTRRSLLKAQKPEAA